MRVHVKSSNVLSIGFSEFDPVSETGVLTVEFQTRAVYAYYGVPVETYEDLLDASHAGQSVGSLLAQSVKAKGYPYCKVADVALPNPRARRQAGVACA